MAYEDISMELFHHIEISLYATGELVNVYI
jgi:hypothetical protein